MAQVNQGEIWQFSFPSPDRRRPVLVLTRQGVIAHLHTVTVAPITTTVRGIPSEVVIGTKHTQRLVGDVRAGRRFIFRISFAAGQWAA